MNGENFPDSLGSVPKVSSSISFMIHSMTAFARYETQGSWGSVVWEIRSTNHRYLEVNLRLPETLNRLELMVRKCLKNKVQRGKVEVNLRYQPPMEAINQISINQELALQLIKVRLSIANLATNCVPLDPTDILQWPGVIRASEAVVDDLESILSASFEHALNELISLRNREGKALQKVIEQRLANMQIQIDKVKNHLPAILNEQREKILKRLAEAKLSLDPTRLEQEMVLFAQKIDVVEELDRLETHIAEIHRTLQQTGPNGRRLDFLLQELNREANTLGAKSVNPETSMASVELKVLIEQMREQVQNIE